MSRVIFFPCILCLLHIPFLPFQWRCPFRSLYPLIFTRKVILFASRCLCGHHFTSLIEALYLFFHQQHGTLPSHDCICTIQFHIFLVKSSTKFANEVRFSYNVANYCESFVGDGVTRVHNVIRAETMTTRILLVYYENYTVYREIRAPFLEKFESTKCICVKETSSHEKPKAYLVQKENDNVRD